MATKRQNLQKNIKKINSSESVWEIILNIAEFSNISLYKSLVFLLPLL